MDKPTIKIFISSPSDVLYERQIAKRIIAKLGKEFAASAKLEALLWEDMPLQVTASFQEGIDRIANANMVDIAIFILWSRLGTPLSDKFVRPDGSYYKSGTEYEFEVMYAANQQSGAPSILAYIKNAPIADAIFQSYKSADFDFEEIGRQQKEAQRFIREKFYDPETKTVYGAYHQFEASTTFEQKLTEHLRRLIIQKIGHEAIPIEWEDNPYVGLRSFRYDENAIFYGRRQAINVIEEKVARWLPDKAPCLFVLGESGSGKSSLVRAGLLPDLIEFGWVENTTWNWFDMMPNQFRGDIYNGLLTKLSEAFPVLNEKSIGKDLMMGKEVNFDHLSDILPDKTDEAVLLFIDQFEEIFTDPLITEEERIRTFALLSGIAATHKIWMIFSMRNDFYHKFIAYPQLSDLKNNSIVYDLPKILYAELQEIIEEPAKKAGLKWETNKQGIPLNKTIIHDISAGVDDLPLIEFALSELYNLRDENNMLTYKSYEEIGKIDGAVVKYVDNFYNTLSEKEKECFSRILSALIAPSHDNKKLYVRKTALLEDLQKTELHKQLINNLINSHILISGKDENDEATVSIVHEILITSWKVIQDWIKQEKYFIDANNHYENLSKYWIEHKKSKNDLLHEATAMKESEYFLFVWENNCSANVRDFLFTSIKRKEREALPWVLFFLFATGVTSLILCINAFSSDKTNFSSNNLITNSSLFVILIYLAWKKIKAVPSYYTINLSLVFWSLYFILSIGFILFGYRDNILVFSIVAFFKLILTVIEKRKIQQWEKRFFKRGFNILSVFLDKSAKTAQKTLRGFVWIVSIALIIGLGVGGVALYLFIKQTNRIEKTYKTLNRLFEGLNTISTLSTSDHIFINKQQVEYLRDNFFVENHNMFAFQSTYYGGWTSRSTYYEYALCQYKLGHPEDFLESIKECIKSDSIQRNLYPQTTIKFNSIQSNPYPQTTIKAAFELGLYDDCRQLLELYKNTLNDTEGRSLDEIDNEFVWTDGKVGLLDWIKERFDRRETMDNDSDDETNTALADPFIGKWQYEANGYRIEWELKDNYNLCHYLFQTQEQETGEWVDNNIAVTRYRFKQMDNKFMMEEYNARSNVLSVSEMTLINDNELQVKTIENGEIRVYNKLK